jgi:hypothetical protein
MMKPDKNRCFSEHSPASLATGGVQLVEVDFIHTEDAFQAAALISKIHSIPEADTFGIHLRFRSSTWRLSVQKS